MKKSNRIWVIAFITLLLTAGCVMDDLVNLDHPKAVKPSTRINTWMVNTIISLSLTDQTMEDIVRDSLFFAAGLPADWNLVSVEAKMADHFRPYEEASRLGLENLDDQQIEEILTDSLTALEPRLQVMQPDEDLSGYFQGRVIQAQDSDSNDISVDVDTVYQWKTFSLPINLNIPAGSPVDTVLKGDELGEDSFLDSAGIVAIPVVIKIQVDAPSQSGDYRLFYYTKTGNFPVEPDEDELVPDVGVMNFVDVNVSPTNSIVKRRKNESVPAYLGLLGINPARHLDALGRTSTSRP